MSFLVPEISRFKDVKRTEKNQSKLIKCVMSCDGLSDSKQSLNALCLGKYFSKSFETLEAETKRHYAKDLCKKLVVLVMMLVPDPFNGYQKVKHNSAISRQNQLELLGQNVKHDTAV